MIEHAVKISEAFRRGASQIQGCLRPALKGCPECRTVHVIASPERSLCPHCGSLLRVLSPDRTQ